MSRAKIAASLFLTGLLVITASGGCGFYFKTYRFDGKTPIFSGMTQEEVLSQWGDPSAILTSGPLKLWKYPAETSQGTQRSLYYLLWFQDGRIVKWGKAEEEPKLETVT